MLWLFVQPFLFGLIGAAVDVYSIDPQIIGVCDVVYDHMYGCVGDGAYLTGTIICGY